MSAEPASTNASDPRPPAATDITTVLHSLSDPVRLEIVRQLAGCEEAGGEMSCGQLDLPVGKSTCSYHFKTLSAAGVIDERQQGTRKYLRLRRADLDRRFPGLLGSVLRAADPG